MITSLISRGSSARWRYVFFLDDFFASPPLRRIFILWAIFLSGLFRVAKNSSASWLGGMPVTIWLLMLSQIIGYTYTYTVRWGKLLVSRKRYDHILYSPDCTTYAVGIRDHAIVGSAFGITLSPFETTMTRRVKVWVHIFDAK